MSVRQEKGQAVGQWPLAPVTGVLLAGGAGRRMGGIDKGWVLWRGKPLAIWVIERFKPQVEQLLIVANRSHEAYAALGYRVVSDPQPWRFAGPLAGIAAALAVAATEWIVTVPCDAPLLPLDLVARFRAALAKEGESADNSLPAVLVAHDGQRPHSVFLAVHRSHLPSVTAFLASGARQVSAWYGTLPHAFVSFADEPDAFTNGNTLQELEALAKWYDASAAYRLCGDHSDTATAAPR